MTEPSFLLWIQNAVGLSSFVATLLIIWFETDAAYEYIRLFRLNKIFGLEKYENSYNAGIKLPDYLPIHRNNFITRLLSCPICLCIWINIIILFFFWQLLLFFFCVILSLVIFFGLLKLMK